MLFYSVCESEKSMCNLIHTVFGRRHWGQTWNWDDPLCAKGHRRSQIHSNNFLSLLCFFHSVLIQNLSRLSSTEVTRFQSTRLVSQKTHLALRSFLHAVIEWMYIAWALPPSTIAAVCHHLLASHCGKTLHSALSQQKELMCQTNPRLLLWFFWI